MLFTELNFGTLLIVTFAIYYTPLLKKFQKLTLIAASSVFYGFYFPYLMILLLISILINAGITYYVSNFEKHHKWLTTTGVLLNLGVLIFFKYAGFLTNIFTSNKELIDWLILIPLPVGISFYTFQGISFLIDAYQHKKVTNTKFPAVNSYFWEHFKNTFLYISFFPQLVAGPIIKPDYFIEQIKTKYLKDIDWISAFQNIITGYFLKMVVADNLRVFTNYLSPEAYPNFSAFTIFILSFGFTIQIFADFGGYSLLAIGFSKLFGYKLIDNFRFPYISQTFSEFWSRWHISLSSWFRDLVYIPLGGNRVSKIKWFRNILITFIISGFWHGASFNFGLWGLAHALLLIAEYWFFKPLKYEKLPKFIKILFVFLWVNFTFLIFKITDNYAIIDIVQHFFMNLHFETSPYRFEWYIMLYSTPVLIYHIYGYMSRENKAKLTPYKPIIFAIFLILLLNNSGPMGEFIYFQF